MNTSTNVITNRPTPNATAIAALRNGGSAIRAIRLGR